MSTAVPSPVLAVVPAEPDASRVAELERLLTLERARRQAMEQGIERLSRRVQELTRENAELREGRAAAS